MLERINSKLQFRVKNPWVNLTCLQSSLTADSSCKFFPCLALPFILFLVSPCGLYVGRLQWGQQMKPHISWLSNLLSDGIFLGYTTMWEPVVLNPGMGKEKGSGMVLVAQILQSVTWSAKRAVSIWLCTRTYFICFYVTEKKLLPENVFSEYKHLHVL